MSTYEEGKEEINNGNLAQTEVHLYGSSRLGILNTVTDVSDGDNLAVPTTGITTFTRGNKFFELSNHLGNVLVTITDKKLLKLPDGGECSGGTIPNILNLYSRSTTQLTYVARQEINFWPNFESLPADNFEAYIDAAATECTPPTSIPPGSYFMADVVTANDYYPFGMAMPGRKFSSGSGYRYGFNGQERSTEINNNSYTAEFWQYDARLGRRWNIDPILKVGESPYSTFSNNPIWFSDYNGADTTLPMAASGSVTLPDQARGGIETYSGAPTYIHGTTTPVPVQQGQLRSFSVPEIGKFSARWEADENGEAVFLGYLNDAGKDFNSAVGEYNAKIDLDNTCKRLNHFFEDPFNQALLILGPVQMQMSMMESGNPSAGNPSVVTSEAFAEIELTTAAEIESGAVLASERVQNIKGIPYPNVMVEGYGEVPFPEGPYTPNNSVTLRPSFTDAHKTAFRAWWEGQGKPWPTAPEGSEIWIHHIKPLSKGGTNIFENLIPLVQPEQHQPFTNWWRSYF